MKRATIEVEGIEYPVTSASWNEDGSLHYVTFRKDLELETAFMPYSWSKEGYQDHGVYHLDLTKRVKWEELEDAEC